MGWPSAVQMSLEVGVFALSTGLAARFAAIDLAAHQLVLNTASVTFMVPLGISSAAAVLVGQAKGRGDAAEARRVGWRCLQIGVGFMALSCVTLLALPGPILGLYTNDPAVIGVGSSILFIAALFQLSDGAQVTGTGILRGLGDTRSSLVMNLIGHWLLGLPLGVLMGFVWGWGLRGIWIGLSIGLTAVALSLVWRWNAASRVTTSERQPELAGR
ncbi:MAG: hypothetical protein EBR88_08910 [Betaproteobacteria bacterium]|nr:hypothetical protein [Betaproteobacteria bacterium]